MPAAAVQAEAAAKEKSLAANRGAAYKSASRKFLREGEPVSSVVALASPHRIKPKRRRVRWRASGRTVYTYVGNNPLMRIDPYGLWAWPSLPQGFVDASAGFGDALSFGITGWARGKLGIGSVNECSGSYHGGQAAGIVAGLIDGEGEADIAFQTAHYADRLATAGLDTAEVEATVAGEVNATLSTATEGTAVGPFSGRLSVGGTQVEYRAYPLPNGSVNVGTIFPVGH